MDEATWLVSEDPAAMLEFARNPAHAGIAGQPYITSRKLRLWACACCRAVWPLLTDNAPCPKCGGRKGRIDYRRCKTCNGAGCNACGNDGGIEHWEECSECRGIGRINRSRRAVEVAERYADGEATYPQLGIAVSDADACWRGMRRATADLLPTKDWAMSRRAALAASWVSPIDAPTGNSTGLVEAVQHVLQYTNPEPFKGNATQAALLRCINGNPWRPVTTSHLEDRAGGDRVRVFEPWPTPTVVALAQAAYSSRGKCRRCRGKKTVLKDMDESPCDDTRTCPDCHGSGLDESGCLDPFRLALLADALEENGCDSADLLAHLRSAANHVKGCWAVDLLLVKS